MNLSACIRERLHFHHQNESFPACLILSYCTVSTVKPVPLFVEFALFAIAALLCKNHWSAFHLSSFLFLVCIVPHFRQTDC